MSPDMRSGFKKGMAPLILAAFLIIIIIGVVMMNITTFIFTDSINEGAMALKSDVYFVRNALDIAGSYYLPECFRHSLYQSMHNNSIRGGWLRIPEGAAVSYEEKTYALWSINARDLSPGAKDFSDALWQSFVMNLGQSLKKREAVVLVKVTLPEYRPEDISLSNVGNLKVHVDAKAASPLTASKRSVGDLIQFSKNADMNTDFDSPYFLLYEKAMTYHSDILPRMHACSRTEIGRSEASAFYTASAAVVQDYGSDEKRCLVKVEVATTQKYLISDERTLLYQPIKLTFFEIMDSDYKGCLDCKAQGDYWCISNKRCEDATAEGIPCEGQPAVTVSCEALSRMSCKECLSSPQAGDEGWKWCAPEGVCAQSCPGESVTDPGGCQPAATGGFTFMAGDRIIDSVSGDMLFEYDSPSGMWSSSDWGPVDTEDMLVYIDYNMEGGFVYIRGDWSVSRQYMSSEDLMRDLENGFREEGAPAVDRGAS